jgi:hypothetical protein
LIQKFDQLPKFAGSFLALDRNFLKPKIPLLELLINCQNLQVIFWQLIKCFNNGILGF